MRSAFAAAFCGFRVMTEKRFGAELLIRCIVEERIMCALQYVMMKNKNGN